MDVVVEEVAVIRKAQILGDDGDGTPSWRVIELAREVASLCQENLQRRFKEMHVGS